MLTTCGVQAISYVERRTRLNQNVISAINRVTSILLEAINVSMRVARQGSWLKLRSIQSEKREYREYHHKERVGKKDKPVDYLDDCFRSEERCWKSQRRYQCKEIKNSVLDVQRNCPTVWNYYRYIGKDNKNASWSHLEIYFLVGSGKFFHSDEWGHYLTNSDIGFTTDSDYCTFIPEEQFWNDFEELEWYERETLGNPLPF